MLRSLDEFTLLWKESTEQSGVKLVLADEYREKHYFPYKKPPMTDEQRAREAKRIDFLCQRDMAVISQASKPVQIKPSKVRGGKRAL